MRVLSLRAEGRGKGWEGRRGKEGRGRGRKERGRKDEMMTRDDHNVWTQVSHIKIIGELMRHHGACGHTLIFYCSSQAEISWLPPTTQNNFNN